MLFTTAEKNLIYKSTATNAYIAYLLSTANSHKIEEDSVTRVRQRHVTKKPCDSKLKPDNTFDIKTGQIVSNLRQRPPSSFADIASSLKMRHTSLFNKYRAYLIDIILREMGQDFISLGELYGLTYRHDNILWEDFKGAICWLNLYMAEFDLYFDGTLLMARLI